MVVKKYKKANPFYAILIYMDLETLLKHTSRSLYLSARILPATMRPAFSVAYLLCRYADTIADTALLPAERRLYWIERFPEIIQAQPAPEVRQLAQEIEGGSENPYEKMLIQHLPDCLQAFNHIAPAQQSFILEVAQAVCAGMQTDLKTFPTQPQAAPVAFQTSAELEYYCRLMGGEPGLFWSRLIYHTTKISARQEDFHQWGMHIGDTLQIVNILRDMPKDLKMGRCYFPEEDLKTAGLTPADLLNPVNSARFEPVKRKWIRWGLTRLKDGIHFFNHLPKTQLRQRAAVAWPILWAADTLCAIYREPDLLNPEKRVKIPRSTIYRTILCTPPLWLSNRLFAYWLNHKIRKLGLF